MQVSGRGFVQDQASCVDKRCTKSAAATLAVYEQIVECDTTSAGFTLRMPPVSEAAGKMYSIMLIAGAVNAVTLAPYATSESYDWTGDFTIDAALDRILLFSDGRKWWVVENLIS